MTGTGDVYWYLTDNLGTVRDMAQYNAGTDTTTVVMYVAHVSPAVTLLKA